MQLMAFNPWDLNEFVIVLFGSWIRPLRTTVSIFCEAIVYVWH